MRNRPGGFTLLEVMIALVLLAIIVLGMIETFMSSQDACSMGGANVAVQATSTRCMAEISRRIREARVFGIGPDGSWIRLQVPVDHDGDGDVLDDNRQVEWGARGKLNWYLEYAFHTVPNSEEWVFDEGKEGHKGIDLNQDGDISDAIEFGCIVERIKDDNGIDVSSRALTPPCVILDIDSDGVRDPLFERLYGNGTDDPDGTGPQPADNDGPNIRISFRSFKRANKGRRILLHPTSMVGTRNY